MLASPLLDLLRRANPSPIQSTRPGPRSHYKELECHRLAVEPLLYKYGVNAALHGHVHGYERTLK